jgi:uncharacterized membrane protein
MTIEYMEGRRTASAGVRLLVAMVCAVAAFVVSAIALAWYVAPLIAWDVFALLYLAWIWLTIRRLDKAHTASFAIREDPSRLLTDTVLIVSSVVSLGAVATVLLGSDTAGKAAYLMQICLGVISVVISWALVHTVYMLKYAEMYYADSPGGVEIEGAGQAPTFGDFAYLAFTLGMTFQVSDTGLKSSRFRSVALRHALLSYLFGTVIVATTINLVAGLSRHPG